ncbi:MAG: dTDP-glucose 4,6-dehydratase [Deinococcaceae bacterium]
MKTLLVTGGYGFIGSNFVRLLLEQTDTNVIVLDKMTYAARIENLQDHHNNPKLTPVVGDIANAELVSHLIRTHTPDCIVNFAAETHVDQSILSPMVFTETNVLGTHVLLEAAKTHSIRFHQVSTDEVYGHIPTGHSSVETDSLQPRSPYSASKAAADQLVLAYHITYGLPITITRGSNNVGPYQFPEKVLPLFVTNALSDRELPLYGDGLQMRDYTHVHDHCTGILTVLELGRPGEIYNVGTGLEMTNLEMTDLILQTLKKPKTLIRHVEDRLGHDRRYSMNTDKLLALGWKPKYTPQEAILRATEWYANNAAWWQPIRGGQFESYYQRQYGERLEEIRNA